MKARGKREAKPSASPLVKSPKSGPGLKGRNERRRITRFQRYTHIWILLPGATRFALAPGYHIPRRWRCVMSNSHCVREAPLAL